MPGLAPQPVYEVKGTRLSPSSGAYEAPVTGTHWANDGFERRVQARCAPPPPPPHLSQIQQRSIRMCEGNRRRAAKEGTDGGRDGRSCLCFGLPKGGCLSARSSHAILHMFPWPITDMVTHSRNPRGEGKEIILLQHFSPMHEPCRPLSNKGTTCGDYGSPPSFVTVEKAGGANQADRGWSASKAHLGSPGYSRVHLGALGYTLVHRGTPRMVSKQAKQAVVEKSGGCSTQPALRTSMQSFCIHCHDSKIARRPCLVSMTE